MQPHCTWLRRFYILRKGSAPSGRAPSWAVGKSYPETGPRQGSLLRLRAPPPRGRQEKRLVIYSFSSAAFTRLTVSLSPSSRPCLVPPPGCGLLERAMPSGTVQPAFFSSPSRPASCIASDRVAVQSVCASSTGSRSVKPSFADSGSFSASCCDTSRRQWAARRQRVELRRMSSSTSQRGCRPAQSRSRSIAVRRYP